MPLFRLIFLPAVIPCIYSLIEQGTSALLKPLPGRNTTALLALLPWGFPLHHHTAAAVTHSTDLCEKDAQPGLQESYEEDGLPPSLWQRQKAQIKALATRQGVTLHYLWD